MPLSLRKTPSPAPLRPRAARRNPAAYLLVLLLVGCGVATPGTRPFPGSATATYTEPHRPQLHFSPPTSWMNDPNGMVYYDGEYHLFYQYYPDDIVWGPMHWGHAVSRDLVHWEHLPVALYPDGKGYIFSGSAVVDWNNTSGFGTLGSPPLVAAFTYHDPVRAEAGTDDHEAQGIAYSTDHGRTWTKYDGNPVLPNPGHRRDFRDPNVFWHAPSHRWIMALSAHDHVELWASPDLKEWTYRSSFGSEWGAHGGVWECPDLFPLADPATGATRWILIVNLNPGGPQGGSGTQYFIGDFDGTAFTLDPDFAATLDAQEAVWLDWGRDDYAGVTWADVPEGDGRRIFLGWMSNWDYAQQVPTRPWRSAMTLPRTLRLMSTPAGYRVFSTPVRELTSLRTATVDLPRMALDGSVDLTERLGFPPTPSELRLELRPAEGARGAYGIILSNALGQEYRMGFDAAAGDFFSDRTLAGDHTFSEVFADRIHRAPRASTSRTVTLRVFIDVASIEVFADDGATVMTETFFPGEPFDRIRLFAQGGAGTLVRGEAHELRSIWEVHR